MPKVMVARDFLSSISSINANRPSMLPMLRPHLK